MQYEKIPPLKVKRTRLLSSHTITFIPGTTSPPREPCRNDICKSLVTKTTPSSTQRSCRLSAPQVVFHPFTLLSRPTTQWTTLCPLRAPTSTVMWTWTCTKQGQRMGRKSVSHCGTRLRERHSDNLVRQMTNQRLMKSSTRSL